MTTFKKGDKFIPRKPKDITKSPAWRGEMDKYDGKELTVDGIDDFGRIQAEESGFMFHPDWCEKVGDEVVNFVQREGTEIISESITSTSVSANITFIQPEFPPKQDDFTRATTKYEEGTSKSPYEPLKVYPTEPPFHEAKANFTDGGKLFSVEGKVDKVIDWEQRKWDASVAAMQGLLASGLISVEEDEEVSTAVSDCIRVVDEMIKQFKQKEDE